MGAKNYQMDMCRGPLFRQMVVFSLPLMAASILQLTFNAVNMVVVGQFSSHQSLAAVGCCGNIYAFLINVLGALAIGTNVLVSRYFGAKTEKEVQKCVHTSLQWRCTAGAPHVFWANSLQNRCCVLQALRKM
jgi:Na+-driven multidrug efflux pump